MSATLQDILIARNPSTGGELGQVPVTPSDEVVAIVNRAREAQREWGQWSWGARRSVLRRFWSILSREADLWADTIRDEIGKPRSEAYAGDLIGTLDGLRWIVRGGGRALRDEWLSPGHQRFLQMPGGRLTHAPVGVVGIIGTWNYPLILNALPIAAALAAGNGVVWKPSELAPLCGQLLQSHLDAAGFPEGLVAGVFGGAEVGRALVGADIDKGLFTGGIENGRRVLTSLAARGIPGVVELSGFDPAILLPDARASTTIKPLAWSAFVGAGQTCVSVKRVLVVGDPTPWAEELANEARSLRVGDPATDEVDLGPLISEAARDRMHEHVCAAVDAGAHVLTGGRPIDGHGWFYPPTVLTAAGREPEELLAGVFGPVVIVRGVATIEEAIAEANASRFGLAASVWGRDLRLARSVADRLVAGTVTINDAVTPTMHASAPFGGTKASGFGRTHGAHGLREFTHPRVVFARRAGGFRPSVYPYKPFPVEPFLRLYRRIFH